MNFPENAVIVEANGGDDNKTGAAMTAKYASLENYGRCTIVIMSHAWAGGTAAVTVNYSSNLSGSSTGAQGFAYQWTGDSSDGALTKTAVTSNTFTVAAADQTHIIDIRADDLPEGYPCLTLAVASPGSNNDYYSAFYILREPRYAGDSLIDPTS